MTHVDGAPATSNTLPESPPSTDRRARAHEHLLRWYAAHGRDLPWRQTRDPYAVLVSEVMLQQTQVERVLPKYREFLERFPTLAALAEAPTADVIRAWAPLGYNVRAVRLQAIARQAAAEHGGALPRTLDGLLALKGIGRYTAGAVACFAFGLPVPTVDTNIRRVLWRVFRGIEPAEWPAGQAGARELLGLAEWALPAGAAYDWQQALMDLGATTCVSRRPACERCPLAGDCRALEETGSVTLFPSGEALAALRDARHAAQTLSPAPPNGEAASRRGAERMVAEPRAAYTPDDPSEARPSTGRGKGHGRRRGNGTSQPFTSTSRYFRGRVLAALRALPPGETLALSELGPRVRPEWQPSDVPWLRGIVTGLARDGLLRLVPGPEAGEGEETRVALP